MKGHHESGSRRLAALALVLLSMSLASCGVLVTLYASLSSNDGDNDVDLIDQTRDEFLVDMASRFGLMALFAETVYRRELPESDRDSKACAYLSAASPAEVTRYGMPHDADGPGRWQRWVPKTSTQRSFAPCLNDASGLHYETYVYANASGQFEEAVIAFRGTENRSGQMFKDWGSNLSAFLGFEPEQYAVARQNLVPLLAELEAVLVPGDQGPRIYATGHSLGGGLAQQAGYMSRAVKEVFTFNTSPVTNWSRLRLDGQVRNAYPIFHRIYHGGEILEKVRFISTSVTQARYGRHDIGLQFKGEGRASFGGHSMQIIACNFAQLIDDRKDKAQADHHLARDYVRNVMLNQSLPDVLCRKPLAGAG